MYSSIKNARRAVKKMNLADTQTTAIVENADGTFSVEIINAVALEPIVPEPVVNVGEIVIGQPSPIVGAAVLPDPVIVWPTAAATPFAFIWSFLDANPELSRKAQIAAMIAHGLNANTVKTQVSRYTKVGGVKANWLAGEKAKRDAEKAKIDAMVAKIVADKAEAQAIAGAAAVA